MSILSGRIGIRELIIKSPRGYADEDMFALESAKLEVRIGSLWDQPVHVRQFEITKPLVRVEAGPGGSNVRVFLDNVHRNLGMTEETRGEPRTRMWIDRLVLKDATVRIGSRLTKRGLMDISLETVELRKIRGKDDKGVTSGELVAMIVFDMVRKGALKGQVNFQNLIPAELTRGLQTVMQSAGSVFNGAAGIVDAPLRAILRSIISPGGKPQGDRGKQ